MQRAGNSSESLYQLTKVSGRRIVDIAKIAEDLWCQYCDGPISLRNLVNEITVGIVNIWSIRCHACRHIIKVETSKKHGMFYDSNFKLAIGKI